MSSLLPLLRGHKKSKWRIRTSSNWFGGFRLSRLTSVWKQLGKTLSSRSWRFIDIHLWSYPRTCYDDRLDAWQVWCDRDENFGRHSKGKWNAFSSRIFNIYCHIKVRFVQIIAAFSLLPPYNWVAYHHTNLRHNSLRNGEPYINVYPLA